MKNIMGLLFLGALALGGYYLWTNAGGEISGSAPSVGRPNVELPDANEAAEKARGGLNTAADTVMGLSPNTWKMILIGLVAGYIAWLWFTRPKFKWGIIGAGIMLIVFIGVVPQL